MKKILLLGDSIRMIYELYVKELLKDRAEVVGPDDNYRFVKYTLWNSGGWINELGRPDIVHWNNGIWDVFRYNEDIGIIIPLDEYVRDIRRTLKELRKTGAQIIWTNITHMFDDTAPCRNEEKDLYNIL